jgi:hypothetical protein
MKIKEGLISKEATVAIKTSVKNKQESKHPKHKFP